MSGHTSGPWLVQDNRDTHGQLRVDSVSEGAVCIVRAIPTDPPHPSYTDPTAIADARLIAAAPDLLEALRGLLEWADQSAETIEDEYGPFGPRKIEEWLAPIAAARAALAEAETKGDES